MYAYRKLKMWLQKTRQPVLAKLAVLHTVVVGRFEKLYSLLPRQVLTQYQRGVVHLTLVRCYPHYQHRCLCHASRLQLTRQLILCFNRAACLPNIARNKRRTTQQYCGQTRHHPGALSPSRGALQATTKRNPAAAMGRTVTRHRESFLRSYRCTLPRQQGL